MEEEPAAVMRRGQGHRTWSRPRRLPLEAGTVEWPALPLDQEWRRAEGGGRWREIGVDNRGRISLMGCLYIKTFLNDCLLG